MTAVHATVSRSTINRNAWKVWIVKSDRQGWLRQGFAWKTQRGAINAARKMYPTVSIFVQE